MAATGLATAAAIRTAVLKNLLKGAQLTQVQQLQSRLITIVVSPCYEDNGTPAKPKKCPLGTEAG